MQDEIEALGGKLISISPEKLDNSKEDDVKDAESLITSDINNKFTRNLGLLHPVNDEMKEFFLSIGRDLNKANGTDIWELPMTATIITDTTGKVLHIFVDTDFINRMDPDEILEVLKS